MTSPVLQSLLQSILQSLYKSHTTHLLLLICCMLIPLNFRFIQLYISIRNSSTYFLISSNSALTSGTSDDSNPTVYIHNLVPWLANITFFLYTSSKSSDICPTIWSTALLLISTFKYLFPSYKSSQVPLWL